MRPAGRLTLAVSAGAVLMIAVAPTAATAPAQRKLVTRTLKLTLRAAGGKGTLSGKLFGPGKVTIETDPPQYYLMTWKFARGSVNLLVWLPDERKGTVIGTQCRWRFGGGTGRYTQIRGQGTMTGSTDGATWTVTVTSTSVRF